MAGLVMGIGAFPVAQRVKNLPAMQETTDSIPALGKSPRGRHSSPLQYSCLENPVDIGA